MTDTTQTTTLEDTRPIDTVDEDLEKAKRMIDEAARDMLDPQFDVPAAFAKTGYERLPYGGGLFGIRGHYIYRPMRAWDAAQKFADELIALTGGSIFVLVHDILALLRVVGQSKPADGETPEQHSAIMGEVFIGQTEKHWQAFLDACPRVQPFAAARRVIEACEVRRLVHPGEADKPESERDTGGLIFNATGPGAVERFYRGRRHQILRVAIAATWGSVGDFFVPG